MNVYNTPNTINLFSGWYVFTRRKRREGGMV